MKPNLLPQTHSVIFPKKGGCVCLPSVQTNIPSNAPGSSPLGFKLPSPPVRISETVLNCLLNLGSPRAHGLLVGAKPTVNDVLISKSMGHSSAFTPSDFSPPSEPTETTLCLLKCFSSLGFLQLALPDSSLSSLALLPLPHFVLQPSVLRLLFPSLLSVSLSTPSYCLPSPVWAFPSLDELCTEDGMDPPSHPHPHCSCVCVLSMAHPPTQLGNRVPLSVISGSHKPGWPKLVHISSVLPQK